MELHRMVTQPQFTVFASTPKRLRTRTIHGTEFRFAFVPVGHLFGVATHWITKQEAVRTSDLERTPIDGLRQPEYCGGIAEVAKGLWMRRDDLKTSRVVEYALRLRVGSVIRRLGYLLDLYRLAPELELERLRSVDLRKMKAHGLIERDGKRYAYRLTGKGTKAALTFVLFHQRLCGPLANSLFHHQPNSDARPSSKLEAAYHKADASIRNVIQLLEAA